MSCHPHSLQHPKQIELMDVQSLARDEVDDLPVLLPPSVPGLFSNIQLPLNWMVIFRFSDQLLRFGIGLVLQFSPIWAESWCPSSCMSSMPRSRISHGQLGWGGWTGWLMELSCSDQKPRPGAGIQHDPTLNIGSFAQASSNIYCLICPVLTHITPDHHQ